MMGAGRAGRGRWNDLDVGYALCEKNLERLGGMSVWEYAHIR